MLDILLINSPIILYKNKEEKEKFKSHGGDESSYYPLNILYLASYLEKKGHSVKVLDTSAMGYTLWDIVAEIHKDTPKIIGISAMTASIQSALTLGKYLKKCFLDIPVGIGGVHVTIDPTFIDRYPIFDFCVLGEGEITLEYIVTQIKKGDKIKKLYVGRQTEDLDELPFPARHLIDYSIYKREEQMSWEIPAAGILSSRGCPYNCIFCCIPAKGKKVRFRSAKNIVDEMESVYEQCKGSYSFVDDCFIINRERTIGLCKEIIKRKLKTKFIASSHADRLDEETASYLSRVGCTDLYFGIESGSERIRNQVIGKRLSDRSIRNTMGLCKKYGITSNLFLMAGFPTETKQEINETINFGLKVEADNIGIHITCPLPGSQLYQYCLEHKYIEKTMIDNFIQGKLGKGMRGVYPLFIPMGMTLENLVNAKKQTYRKFYLHPRTIGKRIMSWIKVRGKFKDDMKLFKIAPHILLHGGSKGQLS